MTRITRRGLIAATLALHVLPALAANPTEPAPEFEGLENWINSDPLTMGSLRGKVVLVDFWTFGCVNCINTLPHLTQWHETHAANGLVIVGIHTPEFPFERDLGALQDAVARHGIAYPVVQDNRYRTWQAYGTRYWPTSVLVNREGRIVKYHEGDRGLEDFRKDIEVEIHRPS
ncbi:redoxin domain-containing protein [Falsirhodobacter deserti]|uniref:redoxin domain-containing protein n=1 Tax=Falsirhodobacter deserti TaxID=1365611 RepID=UPI000FE2AADD|nr:redoxin domain-containing protein [Falsirhodobacter deserti]